MGWRVQPLPGRLSRRRFGGEDRVKQGIDGGNRWGKGFRGRGSEEDGMSDTTPALDEAFERMAAASFELPNGFVNHGAMACEALAMLDCAATSTAGRAGSPGRAGHRSTR